MTKATCCMVTQAGYPCSRRVEYEGMVCRQHWVMLAKQARQGAPPPCDPPKQEDGFWDYGQGFQGAQPHDWDYGDSAPAPCRDRSADLEDDWVGADVADLFGDDELPNYAESERAQEGKRGEVGWVLGAKPPRGRVVSFEGESERERCGRLAQLAAINGVEIDETERIADGSARWIWTVPKARGKAVPKGYFAQFRIDGRMAVRCECPGCAPKPRSKAKLCQRPVRTEDHCVKCTCAECVCPARVTYGLESQRALTGWWDNPCGGKCGGCKKLARQNCAGAARGWTE